MSAEPISGAEIVIKALVDQGVDVVFGYPGGAVLPIYDALFKQNALRHILVRQEGGAVHAAEGYARSTGRVGVVLVTSGPGATNAVTGLTDALMDSVPVVCLTGQVPTHLIGNDAFQEADTTGITRPCTKHNYLVKDVGELARTLHEAFYVAKSGRPGPVVVDLPKDILFALGPYSLPQDGRHKSYRPQLVPDPARITEAARMIAAAKRPLFYGGGGLINSGPEACAGFTELVRATDAPCTLTLMGLGAFPASDPHFLGMVGMHGTYEANLAMHGCDLMIAVGARFDDRVTGRLNAFSPGSKKIHVDIDPSSINKNVRVDLPILGDAGQAMTAMLAAAKPSAGRHGDARQEWWRTIEGWRARDCLRYDNSRRDLIKPQYALERLYRADRGPRPLHHHRGRPAPDVGGAIPEIRRAVSLDDFGRARHHGLRPAGGGRRADRAPRGAGHRRRRRGFDPDEHPGNVDRRPVPPAGQSIHLEQPVYGHGAPVAGIAAWRPLFRELYRGTSRFRQIGRRLRRLGAAGGKPEPSSTTRSPGC